MVFFMITGNSWLSQKVEVRESLAHGKGIFARESISSGERVAVFGSKIRSARFFFPGVSPYPHAGRID
jgi:hypothetical protein